MPRPEDHKEQRKFLANAKLDSKLPLMLGNISKNQKSKKTKRKGRRKEKEMAWKKRTKRQRQQWKINREQTEAGKNAAQRKNGKHRKNRRRKEEGELET